MKGTAWFKLILIKVGGVRDKSLRTLQGPFLSRKDSDIEKTPTPGIKGRRGLHNPELEFEGYRKL